MEDEHDDESPINSPQGDTGAKGPPEPGAGDVPPTPPPMEADERKLVIECQEEGDGLVCRITPDAKRRLGAGLVDSITLHVIRDPEPIPDPSLPDRQQADGTDDEA